MTTVVVPVRFPLTGRSRRTMEEGLRLAEERDGRLIVLHINLYQDGDRTTPAQLKRAIESEFGRLPRARYEVRGGFIIEETLLAEIEAEDPDVVVIGARRDGPLGRLRRVLVDEPDVEPILTSSLECEVVTVD